MDLRAVLNDSSDKDRERDRDKRDSQGHPPPPPPPKQPPRLYTSHSSYSDRPPSLDDRHAPPQSAYAAESRSGGPGYFSLQSPLPHHNSASTSTPSVGTHSASTYHSPGSHGHYNVSRENSTPHSGHPPNYIPSPSPANNPSPYPSTPTSLYPHHPPPQTPSYNTPYSSQPPLQQRPQTREGSVTSITNGVPPPHSSHMSPPPPSHYNQAPSTPLGPPAVYPRPSPHAHRPQSQGYDSYRRSSVSSVGSAHSRDHTAPPMPHPVLPRAGSVQRTPSGDDLLLREQQQDRERSFSVSPKTIPHLPPNSHPNLNYQSHLPNMNNLTSQSPLPNLTSQSPLPNLINQSSLSNLTSAPSQSPQPNMNHDSLPPSTSISSNRPPDSHIPSTSIHNDTTASFSSMNQSSLKRTASVISTTTNTTMPPQKRVKREVPIWAQSARHGNSKPIKFLGSAPPTSRTAKSQTLDDPITWEPSITNQIPQDEIVKYVCDWLYEHIGNRQPPRGAVFEIEAKIGEIQDTQQRCRVRSSAQSATIFDKAWHETQYDTHIRFESTMTIRQHKFLNDWLNQISRDSFHEAHTNNPTREVVRSAHTKETDEFFELLPAGVQALGPDYDQYSQLQNRPPRVRRTTNDRDRDRKITASIIKFRIADLEVYNPQSCFDYRISINLEAPWNGLEEHIGPMLGKNATTRTKDRVSYRHLAYQIDLTQISHAENDKKEHELEVEISVDETQKEIENLLNGRESNYFRLVEGFLNNVRLICREGTRLSQES